MNETEKDSFTKLWKNYNNIYIFFYGGHAAQNRYQLSLSPPPPLASVSSSLPCMLPVTFFKEGQPYQPPFPLQFHGELLATSMLFCPWIKDGARLDFLPPLPEIFINSFAILVCGTLASKATLLRGQTMVKVGGMFRLGWIECF